MPTTNIRTKPPKGRRLSKLIHPERPTSCKRLIITGNHMRAQKANSKIGMASLRLLGMKTQTNI